MALQAVLRGENIVTKENVQQVVEFLQCEVAVREAVSPVIAENPVAQMEELIRRFLQEGTIMTKRELQRKTNYSRLGIEIFDRAITNMTRNEEITKQEQGKSILYTHAGSSEHDSEASIGVVVNSGEDTVQPPDPNENAAPPHVGDDRLQFSALPEPEMMM